MRHPISKRSLLVNALEINLEFR
ncbi:protein of unknown function [Burkholderia multivorans]